MRDALAATRLLTLTGAGGSGKTRLALEVALRELAAIEAEGAWVELAPLSDPTLMGDAVLASLGARDETETSLVKRVAALVGNRPFLLVLDNAEHLLEACASLVHGLLSEIASLRILVTSRSALGVTGETAWLVPPLSLAAPGGTPDAESEALELFVQRGRAASPAFSLTSENREAVAQICRRLDGLPLALELAAARLRALTPDQIAARLDDRFRLLTTGNRAALPRQQTLRAAIDWSYSLLDEGERTLFARLSVFRGSFTIEAVEAVGAGDPIAADEVLDLLSSLVEQSLVEVIEAGGHARYRLLETMRQYAEERLVEAGDLETRMRRHAAYYGAVIREVEPQLRTVDRPAAMARLLPELENLRHAMACSRQCDVQIHLRIVGLLHWFWFGTGQWPEAQQWLQGALSLPEAQAPTLDRAHLLFSAGAIAALQARSEDAREQLLEAEAIAEREGDQRLLANIRNYLGMALNQVGDPAALEVILRTRPWIVEANDLYALRLNFLLHGQALLRQQDLAGALQATEEAVRVARVFGLQRELGIALQQLATIVARSGDWRRSRSLLRESLQAMRGDPMLLFISRALELMASSAAVEGDAANAGRLYGAAQSIRESIGAAMWGVDRDQHAPSIARAQSSLGAAAYRQAEEAGRALKVDQAIDLALSVGEQLGYTTGPDRTEQTGRYHTAEYPVPHSALATAAVPSLTVKALGGLEVLVDGEPLTRKDWAYSRTRELLLFLLVHPDGRTREQVGVALWPEASATQLRNNFHVAIHHLRRALGHADWVRFERDRYRVDVPGGIDFDAAAFEDSITSGLRAGRRGAFPIDAVSSALQRYGGDFLDGESAGDWHYEMRDRLARLYGDGSEALGAALMAAQRWDDAVAVLSRLVEREPLRESAWRALMSARARSGDTAGALRDYRTLEGTLRREGIARPGRETVELYRRLQG